MSVFEAYPKTPRLFRDVVITEKIDGTNAAVVILPSIAVLDAGECYAAHVTSGDIDVYVYAQSRNRLITPGKNDNAGFAGWVADNADVLAPVLGLGRHFGEWYGQRIQRGYGLTEKRFALFNVDRWSDVVLPSGVETVPVLYRGPFDTGIVDNCLAMLRQFGSRAVPGYMNPEGVIVYHKASRQTFKALIENDDQAKGAA